MTTTGTLAADRELSADATTERFDPLPLEPGTVLTGPAGAGIRPLTTRGAAEVGVWELSPGTVTDVESDEVFVVIAGRGRVTFSDGSSIVLRPGAAVRLVDGDRTTWEITETLRKVYVA